MSRKDNLRKGVLLAFITSIISGMAIFYAKIAVVKIDPLVLTTSRNMVAGLLLAISYWLFGKRGEIRRVKKSDWVRLLLIGIIGGSLPFVLFFTGLRMVGPQTANLIHKTLFIWVTVLAVLFLKEKLTLSYIIAFILIFLGNFYFAKLPLTFGRGELLIFLATLLWSIENILAKKALKNVSSELVGVFRMGIGSLVLFFSIIISGKAYLFSTYDFNKLTIILIGGTILFFYVYFWYKALKYASASLVTLVLSFSVVVGNILNGGFAGVKIFPKDIYSSTLIFLAIGLLFFQIFLQKRLSLSKTVFKKMRNG